MSTTEDFTVGQSGEGVINPEMTQQEGRDAAAMALTKSDLMTGQSSLAEESTSETKETPAANRSEDSKSGENSSVIPTTRDQRPTYIHPEISTAIGASEPIVPRTLSMRVTPSEKTRALSRPVTFHPEISAGNFADDAYLRTVSMRVTTSEQTRAVGTTAKSRPESSAGMRAEEWTSRRDSPTESPTEKVDAAPSAAINQEIARDDGMSTAVPMTRTSSSLDKPVSDVVSMMTPPEISKAAELEARITSPLSIESSPLESEMDNTPTEELAKHLASHPEISDTLPQEGTRTTSVSLEPTHNLVISAQGVMPASETILLSPESQPESRSLPKNLEELVKLPTQPVNAVDGAGEFISDDLESAQVSSLPDHSQIFLAGMAFEKTPSTPPPKATTCPEAVIITGSTPENELSITSISEETSTHQAEELNSAPKSSASVAPVPENSELYLPGTQQSSPEARAKAEDFGVADPPRSSGMPQTTQQSWTIESLLNTEPENDAESDAGSPAIRISREISIEDRRAIINALARKTVSQNAVFQEIPGGERKYISETAVRKTITDHSKDLAPITAAEREALLEFASRRTLIDSDKEVISACQERDGPVWYTNPISSEFLSKDVTFEETTDSHQIPIEHDVSMSPSPAAVKEEVTKESVPGKQSATAKLAATEQSDKLPVDRISLDHQCEVAWEKSQHDVERLAQVFKDLEVLKPDGTGLAGRKSPMTEPDDVANVVSSFPIDAPLLPFSKKERRELVRSISMQIKDPEVPLWDMDLADIEEAEKAELERKNRRHSPLSVDPTFGFDEPIKPKAPVRRSKRHRTVRVHATDYARAQAVELQEFCTNKIKTGKYTLVTFLPMNFFLQCTRSANLYFILIAALQLVPGFSPTSWGTTVAPLVFVMLLNAVKEGIDEFKRSLSDRLVNKQKVEVLNENHFFTTLWRSVTVGDIVRVKCDQEFPADLVFLSSSDAKGLAYIETANLDGETDLKIRNAFYKSSTTGEDDETPLSIFSGLTIECELPNNRLYKFEGAINLQVDYMYGFMMSKTLIYPDYGKLPLDTRQILLRGASLRNTDWILGVVVYTGADTKFVRNMIPGQIKITGLERNMNILVAIVFLCQVALCVGLAAANDGWTRNPKHDSYFIPDFQEFSNHIGPRPHTVGAQFGRFLILLNQLIPISLYVTLELVKVVQSFFIDSDALMYHTSSKTHAKARTTSLNEELGQVQYVMADKTGTLTQNIMAFVQCSIGGAVYGTVQHEGGFLKREGNTIHTLCNDPKLIQKLKEVVGGSQDIDSDFLRAFFYHLAICHVVHPVFAKKGEEGFADDAVLKYAGASPDEEALVQGAADCGYQLKKRTQDELLLYDPELGLQKFIIMAVLEFTSERKRMSIICRDSRGRIKLYCKGADSVIFKRLARGQEDLVDTSLNQLEDFARCGYRTMCMAEREISGGEYERWAARFRAASIALDDRDEKLAAVSETIERDMFLLGVTAVEDKLQGKVPETITLLAQAGIKVWVLTGDKLETSVSVALSCNLLADSMHLFLLSDNVAKSVPQLLRSMVDEARKQHRAKVRLEGSAYHSEMAAVIEGSSLTVALEEGNKMLLLELLKLCRSVVCCRVSPIQKAQVTMLLKDHGNAVILAVGDGANDCGMIKVAHIGVGIGGREGMAAVLASDYSMTRFRYLRRLLLVHGRWSYLRNRELVMYAFYKNIVYALGNAYLAFYSGFSSQALYCAVEIATYNLVWTSLPTIAFAVFNKDLSDCTAENNPQLYLETQNERRSEFFWCLFGWMICAIWDSIVAFFFPIAGASVAANHGESMSLWEVGSTIYTMAIFIVNVKIFSRMHSMNWFHFAAFHISTSLWLLVFFCISFTFKLSRFFPDLAGIGKAATERAIFWLLLLLCPMAAFLPYFVFKVFHTRQAPADFEIMREIEHGWMDGQFTTNAKDYVEQITAPISERRISLEQIPDDDYGPSPLQKEIADKREAVLGGRRASAKSEDPTGGKMGSPTDVGSGRGEGPQSSLGQEKGDQQVLKPRRLTWRQVVNDDELEDLATMESLGRDGRRSSNGFQVVTRHDDAPQAPLPIALGPVPTTRKSVTFAADEESRPSSVSSERPMRQKTPEGQPQHPKQVSKKHRVDQQLEDSRLKAVRANLAKHAEERRNFIPGSTAPATAPKRQKKKQKLWDVVKQGAAEPDPFRDQRHPLQRMKLTHQPSTSTTPATEYLGASRPSAKASSRPGVGSSSSGAPSGHSSRATRPGGSHAPGVPSAAPTLGAPSSSGSSSREHSTHLAPTVHSSSSPHHASGSGTSISSTHRRPSSEGDAGTSSTTLQPESSLKDEHDPILKSKGGSKGHKAGPGRSRLRS